ncbi:Acyltransferase sidL [Hyphodiscus hymeniophilus]|uniref:Acyltransferase sidL n=1 Tax=Hyphodiscus hymeniophilus TaxID=353542 RepID=A0A9P7B0M0_9HELO|nr:Acyltransferase sidL [Hyphodiscus hymeniophilus]
MAPTPSIVHLPNGQNLSVQPVFGGFFFKSVELNLHHNVFPAGWTVIIQSEDYSDEHDLHDDGRRHVELSGMPKEKRHHIHPFKEPTLRNDNLFISSISNPSSNDFKAPASPTRQIAMMLWASLYWYFHLKEPCPHLHTEQSRNTPDAGKPKGEWRINIKREGVLRGRNLVQKLERMGLLSSEDSSVGVTPEENTPEGWSEMFISRRTYWQLSAKLFLFTLTPTTGSTFPASPFGSRPSSPVRGGDRNQSPNKRDSSDIATQLGSPGLWSPSSAGPFSSGSHLPTYFPPPPIQYTITSGVRHPIRPKPPRQGEIFYARYVPSVGQYLTFRTVSLSSRPVAYNGPTTSLNAPKHHSAPSRSSLPAHISAVTISEIIPPSPTSDTDDTTLMTDLQLLNKWMNIERVSKFWGCSGPQGTQEQFLKTNLSSRHSFPVIGMWDGKPFGYFEIYWVKEDILGKHLGEEADNYDRGVHVLVGEDEFRGEHRVKCWITALAHWAFIQDYRTNAVVLEPRVDNER